MLSFSNLKNACISIIYNQFKDKQRIRLRLVITNIMICHEMKETETKFNFVHVNKKFIKILHISIGHWDLAIWSFIESRLEMKKIPKLNGNYFTFSVNFFEHAHQFHASFLQWLWLLDDVSLFHEFDILRGDEDGPDWLPDPYEQFLVKCNNK